LGASEVPPPVPVLVVVGPTASGKSALAMELGRRLPVEIVCCDAFQVYRGMDVGTGKPTDADRREVPHHLVDVAEPSEPFHAARWAELAGAVIPAIAARGRTPLVVGGTGLYLRALLRGLFDAPPPDAAIRQRHRDEAERAGVEALHARLAAIDPQAALGIERRDLLRISRALEVYEQTGVPISTLWRERAPSPAPVTARVVVLDPPVPALRARIAARVDAMMAAGFLDEVRRLRAAFGSARPLEAALGYRQLGAALDGRTTLEQAVVETKAETARYARRQRTWFRHEPGALRLTGAPQAAAVLAWWQGATLDGTVDAAAAAGRDADR
jgi:tRNA dimethylallyltransferase